MQDPNQATPESAVQSPSTGQVPVLQTQAQAAPIQASPPATAGQAQADAPTNWGAILVGLLVAIPLLIIAPVAKFLGILYPSSRISG